MNSSPALAISLSFRGYTYTVDTLSSFYIFSSYSSQQSKLTILLSTRFREELVEMEKFEIFTKEGIARLRMYSCSYLIE
jgi:hypothetical protein